MPLYVVTVATYYPPYNGLVYPFCVGVVSAIAYFSIVYCFTCMKTHIASENELGEVVCKERYRHLMIIRGPRYVHQSP
jgi:hypothetical protein